MNSALSIPFVPFFIFLTCAHLLDFTIALPLPTRFLQSIGSVACCRSNTVRIFYLSKYISMELCVKLVRRADTTVCREVCANKRTICSRRTVFKHVGYLFDGSVRRRLPFDLFLSTSNFSTQ